MIVVGGGENYVGFVYVGRVHIVPEVTVVEVVYILVLVDLEVHISE